jgi:hypothetical protein
MERRPESPRKRSNWPDDTALGPRPSAPEARAIYLLLLIDAHDFVFQTVALRVPTKKRAIEIGEAMRQGTPRVHRFQLWQQGRKIFEVPTLFALH